MQIIKKAKLTIISRGIKMHLNTLQLSYSKNGNSNSLAKKSHPLRHHTFQVHRQLTLFQWQIFSTTKTIQHIFYTQFYGQTNHIKILKSETIFIKSKIANHQKCKIYNNLPNYKQATNHFIECHHKKRKFQTFNISYFNRITYNR